MKVSNSQGERMSKLNLTEADFTAPKGLAAHVPPVPEALRVMLANGESFCGGFVRRFDEAEFLIVVVRPKREAAGEEGKRWHVGVSPLRTGEIVCTKKPVPLWLLEKTLRIHVGEALGVGGDHEYQLTRGWLPCPEFRWPGDLKHARGLASVSAG